MRSRAGGVRPAGANVGAIEAAANLFLSLGHIRYVAAVAFWVASTLLAAAPAQAQDGFFRVSPGPLSAAHQKWDNSGGCTQCHKLGGGVTNVLCLECHEHRPLRDAIANQRGLHATFTRPCITCHKEHEGRQFYICDWSSLGGQARFRHERTGFALAGAHARVACSACHKKRLKSGRTSYRGLSVDCDACHQNPHRFTNQSLRHNCRSCHVPGGKRQMRAAGVPFNHGKVTGVPLAGKHGITRCTKCHKGARMAIEGAPRICRDCHRTPHGKSFLQRKCSECHSPSRKWKRASFDHGRTKFPLAGKHAKIVCSKCHRSKDKDKKPTRRCAGCHKDPHANRFGKMPCEGCHMVGGIVSFATLGFDHDKLTKFRLTGKHATLWCRACHRGKGPRDFEKMASVECRDCHQHKNAHKGQFKSRRCTECHGQGGSRSLSFDHEKDARFPRLGLHQKLECNKCHKKGDYRSGKLRCVDCHKDSHKGQLGDSCDRCHVPDTKFAKTKIDHNRISKFPLEAKHTKVPCKKCHPQRLYELGERRCFDCHGQKEPHKGKLGKKCATCHIPDEGAPKFVHRTMTQFPRSDSHAEVACSFCHRAPVTPPPEVGWTAGLKPEPVNKLFPVMGKRCADCHADKHEGRYGDVCDSCHRPTKFARVSAATHDTGAFRLGGIHDTLACGRCHTQDRLLAGIGEMCQLCHEADDAHNNALGPYCGECHTQLDWLPPRFNHIETVFPLRGAHVTAECRDCHGAGTYQGVPTNCDFCHLADALAVADPIHAGPAFAACDDCHDVSSFVGVRYAHTVFPLRGRHSLVRCRSCHSTGSYVGAPTDCDYCHYTAYLDPGNQPNHVAAGCATTCEDCHSPNGWRPAIRQCPGQ